MSENVSELFSLGSCSNHFFFRKQGGEIGFCGFNGYGQLGAGTLEVLESFQIKEEIEGIKSSEIVSILSNYWASFLLTTRGKVFSAGLDEYSGHSEKKLQFTQLGFSEEEKVIDIACGCYQTVFMTSQGQFYYCGRSPGKMPDSILKEPAFGTIFLLPELSIPEIMDLNIQSSLKEDIPFKLHSAWHFDIALLPNPKFQELLKEDLNDFEF